MTQELKLICTDFISVNHYLSNKIIYMKVKGKMIPRILVYETPEAKRAKLKFIEHIHNEVKEQNWIMSDNKFQKYYVDIKFYFPRIDMDCNNYYKISFDAITESGSVWIDDTQACERVIGVWYDSKNPRMEMTIHKVEFTGIFENNEQLEDYENKCKTCSRYKRNCSILKNAKEGRIQEEINNCICSKYKLTK